MATEQQIETELYRAITGNRLSARTETLDNAIREAGRLFGKDAPSRLGISRETWRRWNLAPDRKGSQRPRPAHQAGLLALLRRSRLSRGREQLIRAGMISVHLASNYDPDPRLERKVNSTSLGWSPRDSARVLDAYLAHGIHAAAQAFLDGITADHFAEWIDPARHGHRQSYNVKGIDLLSDYSGVPVRRAGSSGRRGTSRRAQRRR